MTFNDKIDVLRIKYASIKLKLDRLKNSAVDFSDIDTDMSLDLDVLKVVNYLCKEYETINGVNLQILRNRLMRRNPNSQDEINTYDNINKFENDLIRIVEEVKSLLTSIKHSEEEVSLCRQHVFCDTGSRLKCVFCGITSEDLEISTDNYNFIKECLDKWFYYLGKVDKKEFDFINFIINDSTNKNPVNQSDILRQRSEVLTWDMKNKLQKARLYDSIGNRPQVVKSSYARKLIKELDNQLKEAFESTSVHKKIIIEEILVAKFEIYILCGCNLPVLMERCSTEEEKIALSKAYYNIYSSTYLINRTYDYSTKTDMDGYTVISADSDINQRIIEMKSSIKY